MADRFLNILMWFSILGIVAFLLIVISDIRKEYNTNHQETVAFFSWYTDKLNKIIEETDEINRRLKQKKFYLTK